MNYKCKKVLKPSRIRYGIINYIKNHILITSLCLDFIVKYYK